ncbi:TonB-like protein [Lutibacter oceani]|uniref:TonB-like protein n=1 Tax=Lutibacter oceani TaxID=1853311 RepID=A0A3D9S1W9_9FLAO|nr:M56 family metallopeptidase [Lutibacter oceani]REE82855.1 TonB-like protein [Lutibacter oceani]
MINYIIQVLLFQALFLAIYDLFLQKETFFKWNRIYLLVTPFLSFLIPLLKFETLQKSIPQDYIVLLPTVFLNPEEIILKSTATAPTISLLPILFGLGVAVFAFLFLVRLFKIIKLITSSKIIKNETYNLVLLKKKQSAFSFFNYIFINKYLLENEELEIIKHELVHCKQRHTIDLLVFELLKIVLWFNPLIYIFQKRITLLHEYISDAEVVKETNKNTYFNKLLSEAFNVENISFINQFFKHSLIKKRIAMITKNKSQKIMQLKYLLIIPVLVGMLFYTSCTDAQKDELLGIEDVLSQDTNETEGKYIDTEQGKIFVGKSLAGQIVPFEEYTEKEKEMYAKFKNVDNPIFELQVVIDKNGDRINFFKTNNNASKYREEWQYIEGESVPFAMVENVPIFPGCAGTEEEMRQCLQENITKHINVNFNTQMANNLGLSPGVKRIFVMFEIDKEGNIIDAKARAPHQSLADEALRVVNSLPKMESGKYLGENVGVKYSLPIAFKVEDKKDNNSKSEASKGNPLYILDGKEISKEVMEKINPDNILKINVLKDESAINNYGEKGKNGVVEITLKKD